MVNIAAPLPEPSVTAVARDRIRVRYAVIGAAALLAGIWAAWLLAWLLGWSIDDLGVAPRQWHGLIGILTAPFAHASFAHLMANTLPMALLATLTLYVYPRAARLALPLIWFVSGAGVWLFARPTVHVGASGIASGLMFFLFVMGLLRRDRLAVVTSLVVFFLYGGMLVGVLPQEENISFEYHLAGAVAGVLAAFLFRARDALPTRKQYSWEIEPDDGVADDELALPRPRDVPVLWRHQPIGGDDDHRVIIMRPRSTQTPPNRTLH